MLVKGWNSPLKLGTQQPEDVQVYFSANSQVSSRGTLQLYFADDLTPDCQNKWTYQKTIILDHICSIQAAFQAPKVPNLRSASICFWYFTIPEGFEVNLLPSSENLHFLNVTGSNPENRPSGLLQGTSSSKKAQVGLERITVYLDCSEEEAIMTATRVRNTVLRNAVTFKPILFVHNPNAGPGNKLAFDWTVGHLLGRGLQVQIFTTRKSGDALEQLDRLTASGEIGDFHCICVWGGDGTIHEVIQGYHQGKQRARTITPVPPLQLALFPGGSASALLYTSLQRKHLELTLTNALYSFCSSSGPKPVDLYKFDLDEGNTVGLLFLSVLAGFLADVDFESEVFRCLGSLRFDLYGAFRCLFPKTLEVKHLAYGSRSQEECPNKLYSLAFLASTSITPTFHFDSAGLSLLPTSKSLVNWLLCSNHEVVRENGPLIVEFDTATTLSIDGEPYRALKLKVSQLSAAELEVSLLN